MSKIIEEAALEYCRENDVDGFTSMDIYVLHQVYDKAKLQKGFKPVEYEHPLRVIKRVRNSMRTRYYFDKTIVKMNGRKISFYKMNERCKRRI